MDRAVSLSATFAALADPTRRAILARLASGEATVSELAAPFHISLAAVSKHLKVLQRAGLVEQRRQAHLRPCRLRMEPLQEVAEWMSQYRGGLGRTFDRLEVYLGNLQDEPIGEGAMPTNLGNNDTEIYAEDTTLVVERIFDAPRELVWEAMTTPKHIARWYGRTGTTTTVAAMDVRPGGKWRLIAHTQDGKTEVPFAGEHLEVDQPGRIVRTFVLDVPPFNSGPPAVETLTLEDIGGKTKVLSSTQFPFPEALSGAMSDGLAEGSMEQYDRLADLLKEIG